MAAFGTAPGCVAAAGCRQVPCRGPAKRLGVVERMAPCRAAEAGPPIGKLAAACGCSSLLLGVTERRGVVLRGGDAATPGHCARGHCCGGKGCAVACTGLCPQTGDTATGTGVVERRLALTASRGVTAVGVVARGGVAGRVAGRGDRAEASTATCEGTWCRMRRLWPPEAAAPTHSRAPRSAAAVGAADVTAGGAGVEAVRGRIGWACNGWVAGAPASRRGAGSAGLASRLWASAATGATRRQPPGLPMVPAA
mmetsp:Transcript_126311/g.369071  ORF Transcript_126311/g.369071 Transcript_126311/m.369071 type:complete len:253 (-) Transcript_126311:222-980(-)